MEQKQPHFKKLEDFTLLNVVGKDILKFHSSMWPLMIKGLDLEIDQSIICHNHWVKDNVNQQNSFFYYFKKNFKIFFNFLKKKMSKSIGNVVDPFEMYEKYPLEALKLYILTNGPLNKDSNFDEVDLVHQYNHFIDKVINCYTRVFGKKMLKNLDFSTFEHEILETQFKSYYEKQEKILSELENLILKFNPLAV